MIALGERRNVQAIISQPSLWRNLALQLPASEHSHNFFFRIFAQHRLCELEHPRIVVRGYVSDISVLPEVYLAAAPQNDSVSTVCVSRDAMRGLVDDAIAVGSGRLEPPAIPDVRESYHGENDWGKDSLADLKAEVAEGVCSRWLR